MLSALLFALAAQVGENAEPVGQQRVSEQIYYLQPYQHGDFSCEHRVAHKQHVFFERRFARRIAELKRREAAVLGPDPGFDVVPIGRCTRDNRVLSAKFIEAVRHFDLGLSALERRWP